MKQLYAISAINEGMASGCLEIIDDISNLEETLDKLLDGWEYTIKVVDFPVTYAGVTAIRENITIYLTVTNHKLNELLK